MKKLEVENLMTHSLYTYIGGRCWEPADEELMNWGIREFSLKAVCRLAKTSSARWGIWLAGQSRVEGRGRDGGMAPSTAHQYMFKGSVS